MELRRVDATPNQRSFFRPPTAICVLPSASKNGCISVEETTSNYVCEPTPPPVLPDTKETGTQCCVNTDKCSDFWTRQLHIVATLKRAYNEARSEPSDTLDLLYEQLQKLEALEDTNEHLNSDSQLLRWKTNLC